MDNGASCYRRYLQGDDSGFVEIIKDHMDGLTLYLNGIVRNIHTAEDLTEETFVKIATRKPRFNGKSSFKTWLYTIGRNVALDHMRRESRYGCFALEATPQQLRDEMDLERAYIQEDQKRILRRTMNRLKPEYRQVLWLVYFEGFSCKEVAVIMKKSSHNVEVLVSRARQALKTKLNEEGFVYEGL